MKQIIIINVMMRMFNALPDNSVIFASKLISYKDKINNI